MSPRLLTHLLPPHTKHRLPTAGHCAQHWEHKDKSRQVFPLTIFQTLLVDFSFTLEYATLIYLRGCLCSICPHSVFNWSFLITESALLVNTPGSQRSTLLATDFHTNRWMVDGELAQTVKAPSLMMTWVQSLGLTLWKLRVILHMHAYKNIRTHK